MFEKYSKIRILPPTNNFQKIANKFTFQNFDIR